MSGYDVSAMLRDADILLIVPPFAWQDRPAIGVHLLQAIARRHGVEVQILYANILFSAWFGELVHAQLAKTQLFVCERLFARAAYGGPALGRDGGERLARTFEAVEQAHEQGSRPGQKRYKGDIRIERMRALEAQIPAWLESFVPAIADAGHRVVGCTTSFEQTSASIAMLSAIKRHRPETIAIIGGANCEAEMAEGMCSLTDVVDYVFSGESERTFAAFVDGLQNGRLPTDRIQHGEPCTDMDALPILDYADYYEQMRAWASTSELLSSGKMYLTYESSRGCWWGAKSHCTFCGLNGQGMASRAKSPDRVIEELSALLDAHPTNLVVMTDNIMPHAYFKTLLPRLERELPGATIMYEQKANLSLDDVRALMRAGVREIQPGIEALSTGLLSLMRKGTTAAQNIALLRFARATGMELHWNLLVGFPNDKRAFYDETLELIPLIHHLQPPHQPCPVVFDRFSPYFDHPEQHGILDLRPFEFYTHVFPETADIHKIAYHFDGSFDSAARAHPELAIEVSRVVHAWRLRFYSNAPAELRVIARSDDSYLLVDTRGLPGLPTEQVIDSQQAAMALVSQPIRRRAHGQLSRADYDWARAHRVVIERDARYVGLAIAEPELMAEFESRFRRPSRLLAQAS